MQSEWMGASMRLSSAAQPPLPRLQGPSLPCCCDPRGPPPSLPWPCCADADIGMVGLGVIRPGQLALLTGSSHLHLGVTDKM